VCGRKNGPICGAQSNRSRSNEHESPKERNRKKNRSVIVDAPPSAGVAFRAGEAPKSVFTQLFVFFCVKDHGTVELSGLGGGPPEYHLLWRFAAPRDHENR